MTQQAEEEAHGIDALDMQVVAVEHAEVFRIVLGDEGAVGRVGP